MRQASRFAVCVRTALSTPAPKKAKAKVSGAIPIAVAPMKDAKRTPKKAGAILTNQNGISGSYDAVAGDLAHNKVRFARHDESG